MRHPRHELSDRLNSPANLVVGQTLITQRIINPTWDKSAAAYDAVFKCVFGFRRVRYAIVGIEISKLVCPCSPGVARARGGKFLDSHARISS
ncbi:MAG: hypothetical protein AB2693_34230 [Candidatus Thiodiazotropha sp.]